MQKKEEIEKFMKTSEIAASLLKSFASIVPFGSIFSELFQYIIPQYREKRIIAYLTILSSKFSSFDEGFIKSNFTDEHFIGLLEDSFRVAVNTVSEKKREYIANIIVKSITSKDVEYTNQKYLLSLLNELNDIEIIILNYENGKMFSDYRNKVYEENKDILGLKTVKIGEPKEIHDKSTFINTYYGNLVRLGLLNERFQTPSKGRDIANDDIMDYKTGKVKVNGYNISELGKILLDYIGINKDNF